MTNVRNVDNGIEKEYEKIILELKKELPNIVLPSMGMLDDVEKVNIDGKNYIISDSDKEE